MCEMDNKSQVIAGAPPDEDFPELEAIDHDERYDFIARFTKKPFQLRTLNLQLLMV